MLHIFREQRITPCFQCRGDNQAIPEAQAVSTPQNMSATVCFKSGCRHLAAPIKTFHQAHQVSFLYSRLAQQIGGNFSDHLLAYDIAHRSFYQFTRLIMLGFFTWTTNESVKPEVAISKYLIAHGLRPETGGRNRVPQVGWRKVLKLHRLDWLGQAEPRFPRTSPRLAQAGQEPAPPGRAKGLNAPEQWYRTQLPA